MKKIFFMTMAFAIMAIISSCKKDYTCICSYSTGSSSYYSSGSTTTLSTTAIKDSKSKATSTCKAMASQYTATYPGTACTIQ